ncbi:MAG: 50S ribosomal protein L15 [bacterium]|nr:50S ribosomal protein L15 [bacterium]
MLSLNTIKPFKGATKKRKRVGRGNASGHGTYSGRGLKGQKSRSGGRSGLKRKGMKQILLQQPKLRGFKSDKLKNQVINISDINKNFQDGAEISVRALIKAGLIKDIKKPVKILGNGKLTLKNITTKDMLMSKSVAGQLPKVEVKSKKKVIK